MLMGIGMLIMAGCALAVFRWRWGLLAAILVGLLQDPLRKMVPGVPGYLAMASVPVWMAVIVSALFSGEVRVREFLSAFPRLARWSVVLGFYLLIPAALSISYGKNCWQIALFGAVVYVTGFLVLVVGWRFPQTESSIIRVFFFYAVGVAILLVGGPLDYFGFGEQFAAIGTEAMGHIWVTYRMGSDGVYMYAGFFRSPDVMGWHAALLTMISGLMAARSRGWKRAFWIALSAWGLLNIWICGRRKMIAMLPVFGGLFLLLTYRFRTARRAIPLAGLLLLVIGAGWYGVTRTYKATAVDTFYMSTLDEFDEKLWTHGVKAVATTIQQAGFWGYGLGMSQQGLHHIQAEKPRVWQEGGPGKLFAELGVPGAILFLGAGVVLLMTAYHVVKYNTNTSAFYVCAGLFSILISNVAAAVVSAQIFGDPLIMLLICLFMGFLLAGSRMAAVPAEGRCPQ